MTRFRMLAVAALAVSAFSAFSGTADARGTGSRDGFARPMSELNQWCQARVNTIVGERSETNASLRDDLIRRCRYEVLMMMGHR